MGFWANLLTHKKTRQRQFLEAASRIRSGLLARLEKRFRETGDPAPAELAAAVACTLFSDPNPDAAVRRYLKANRKKTAAAVRDLADDMEIRRTLTAFFRVVDGIRRRDPAAFRDDFVENPLNVLRENGLLVEDEPEPLVDDFFEMARRFAASPAGD